MRTKVTPNESVMSASRGRENEKSFIVKDIYEAARNFPRLF